MWNQCLSNNCLRRAVKGIEMCLAEETSGGPVRVLEAQDITYTWLWRIYPPTAKDRRGTQRLRI